MLINFVIIIACLLIEGILSGYEVSIISANKLKLHQLAENHKYKKLIENFILQISKVLTTTLVGGNIAIILSSILTTEFFLNFFPETGSLYATLVLTPISIIFAELFPKIIFYRNSLKLTIFFGPIILFIYYLFFPIIFVMKYITKFILYIFGVRNIDSNLNIGKEEIKTIFSTFFNKQSEFSDRIRMVHKSFEITKTQIKQIMIPLVDVFAVPDNLSVKEFFEKLGNNKYTNIPVYQERIDNLIGVINIFDALRVDKDTNILNIIKIVPIYPENKNSMELLIEMTDKEINFAFVTDEFGGISGIITLKDLWEFITGNIEDESISEEKYIISLQNNSYIIEGKARIDELSDNFGLKFPDGDYETINGFLITHLGRIPNVGEVIEYEDYIFTILGATDRQVTKIFLKKRR